MDCFRRAYGLAVANTFCVGGTAMLVYAAVSMARKPHRSKGSIVLLSVVLLFWATVVACVYRALCGILLPWSTLRRCLASVPRHLRLRAAGSRAQRRGGGGGNALPASGRKYTEPVHARAGPGAAGAWRRAGGDGVRHPDVRAAGGRRRRVGVRGVPRGGGEGGRGEAAAGVPAHVPPAVHRPVAAPARDVPGLPVHCLGAVAVAVSGPNGMSGDDS
ncbi:hypothetical protein ZWY2020_008531 [Hordeum vulgare]|nr:hypothetical protein ZWY2020_008531 [Hordeum vulgare]